METKVEQMERLLKEVFEKCDQHVQIFVGGEEALVREMPDSLYEKIVKFLEKEEL